MLQSEVMHVICEYCIYSSIYVASGIVTLFYVAIGTWLIHIPDGDVLLVGQQAMSILHVASGIFVHFELFP